jgi:hypothetical protein
MSQFEQIVREAIEAQCNLESGPSGLTKFCEVSHCDIPAIARAIGERIKEPTEEMIEAGYSTLKREGPKTGNLAKSAVKSYLAMILELLN